MSVILLSLKQGCKNAISRLKAEVRDLIQALASGRLLI